MRYAYLPIVSFNISSYWANYYPTRPFDAELSLYASGGSVTVSIGSFDQPLSPLGSWVLIYERYVWVPRVAANWRPYTDGRWAYTRTQGWMWMSNEPFGGNVLLRPMGLFPDSRLVLGAWNAAGAGVGRLAAVRRLSRLGSAPPDPKDSFGISVDISFGNIPNYYWQAVPARDFQAPNLATVVIGDNNQVTNIVNQTQSIGNVTIVNNVVVNSVVNVNFVEEKTQQKVAAYNVALSPDASKSGKVEGDTIDVFHPAASELPAAEKPTEVAPVEKVAQRARPSASRAMRRPRRLSSLRRRHPMKRRLRRRRLRWSVPNRLRPKSPRHLLSKRRLRNQRRCSRGQPPATREPCARRMEPAPRLRQRHRPPRRLHLRLQRRMRPRRRHRLPRKLHP